MSKTGQVLQSEIVGSVKMKVRLTGMPELRLGLNDKILFENTGREGHHHCCHQPSPLPLRRDTQQGCGAGGREIPPVCSSVAV